MSIPAPPTRLVNAFDGKKAPEKYFAALSEADDLVREVDGLRELRDELAERLRDLDEAHMVTVGLLAAANAQLKRMQATR